MGSKFYKTNVRFQISTFEIACMQNFVKIKKLIHFGPKWPNSDLKSAPLKLGTEKILLKSLKTKFGHLGSNFEKQKLVENSRFLQFCNFLLFQVVSQFFWGGRFSWFQVVLAVFGSFWLVLDFSKYRSALSTCGIYILEHIA